MNKARLKRLELRIKGKPGAVSLLVIKNGNGTYTWDGKTYPDLETIKRETGPRRGKPIIILPANGRD